MAYLMLTTTPHTYNYEHVIHMGGKDELFNYYKNKGSWNIIDLNIPVDGNRTTIEVDIEMDLVMHYDYCVLYEGNKRYYYFIVNTSQKGYITNINVLLDVWNTYIYDCQLNESFIDRCHVNRWVKMQNIDDEFKYQPVVNNVDEGIDYGPKIYNGFSSGVGSKQYERNYIVCSKSPLGVLEGSADGGFDDGNISWENGQLSSKGFRFIKGFEGFGENAYQDSKGFWTIAYGITKHGDPNVYSKLESLTPIGEQLGAKESYKCMNKNYGELIAPICKDLGINKQCQFDALVSFSMNLGIGILQNPNSSIHIALKSKDDNLIRKAFSLYVKSQGETLPGLVARREQETKLFFGEKYEVRPITKIGGGTIEGDGWLPKDETTPDKGDFNLKGYEWIYPTTGTVTSLMHRQNGDYHGAIDIGCPVGTDVKATRGGTVKLADGTSDPNGYGNWIIIEHEEEKLQTYYAHNSKILVKVGDKVRQGQIIAKSGNSGRSSGPHLHYEMRERPYEKANRIQGIPNIKYGQKI